MGPNRIAAERAFGNLSAAYEYDTARRLTKLTATDNRVTKDFLKYVYGWNDDNVPAFEQRNHEAGMGDAYRHDEDHRLTMAGLSQANPTGPPDAGARNRQALTLGAVHERTADALTLAGTTTNSSTAITPRYGYTAYGADASRSYDKAGSLTNDIRGAYQWDARHRLVQATLSDGTVLQYGYDALGRRVEKKKTVGSTSTTTTFLFDGWNVVEEFQNGVLTRETVFGAGLDDSLEYRIFGPSTNRDYEVFRDRSGSTGAVLDDDGTTHLFKYLTFGKSSTIDGSGDYNFDVSSATTSSFWQGLDLDPDLGWYYARNRWYDPTTGTFTSTDPLGYPDSANPYVWGVSSPWPGDSMGLLCERKNASGVFSWLLRCGQDVGTVYGEYVEGTTRDTAKAVVNLATLGGYSGYKRAEARGELAAGLSGGRAYLHGVANFATLGWLDTVEDTAEEGGTLGEGTKTWLGSASGYTDVAEGGTRLGEGEYLEGAGRILAGAGKGAGWIVGARVSYARFTNQRLLAFGRNIGGRGTFRDSSGRLRDAQTKRFVEDPEKSPRVPASGNGRVHNNCLGTCTPARGYSLRDRDTGEVLKYGETTAPGASRYSAKYLEEQNAEMVFEARGTKREMHEWQHKQILDYKAATGHRPPLNKADY